MNSFDPWSSDPNAWRIEGSRRPLPPHGEWRGRLPEGSIACLENFGYSMWHLLAAKALPLCDQEEFLIRACEASADDLLDDLREKMTIFNGTWKLSWQSWSGMHENNRSWGKMRKLTAWCTPLEICEKLGVPLILWPDEDTETYMEGVTLHPVIEAAQMESIRMLNR